MAERQRRAAEKLNEVVTNCPPKRKGRPKGSKNKPKPAVLAVPTGLVPDGTVRARNAPQLFSTWQARNQTAEDEHNLEKYNNRYGREDIIEDAVAVAADAVVDELFDELFDECLDEEVRPKAMRQHTPFVPRLAQELA